MGTDQEMSVEEVALGYVKVANEAMCRPIRQITESKGLDTASHVLAAFGGAGPQHACAIARSLGMSTVFVHRFCGILSAYGMGLADVVAETQRPLRARTRRTGSEPPRGRESRADELAERCLEHRLAGFDREKSASARYSSTSGTRARTRAIMVPEPEDGDFARAFGERFEREYGFKLVGRDLLIDDVRVRGIGKSTLLQRVKIGPRGREVPGPDSVARVYLRVDGGRRRCFCWSSSEPAPSWRDRAWS